MHPTDRGVLFLSSSRKVGEWSDAAKGDVIAREVSAPTAAIRILLGSTSSCDTGERIATRFVLAISTKKKTSSGVYPKDVRSRFFFYFINSDFTNSILKLPISLMFSSKSRIFVLHGWLVMIPRYHLLIAAIRWK